MTTLTMEMVDNKVIQKIMSFELRRVAYQDREDVKQNCIVEILKALKSSSDISEDKFPSFCRTIIKRTIVDYYRKANRKIDQATTYVNFCDGADDENGSTVDYFAYEVEEVGYMLAELQADYSRNIDKFSPKEREVLDYKLFNLNGMTMTLSEIAKELKMNKSSASRAVQKLREICL